MAYLKYKRSHRNPLPKYNFFYNTVDKQRISNDYELSNKEDLLMIKSTSCSIDNPLNKKKRKKIIIIKRIKGLHIISPEVSHLIEYKDKTNKPTEKKSPSINLPKSIKKRLLTSTVLMDPNSGYYDEHTPPNKRKSLHSNEFPLSVKSNKNYLTMYIRNKEINKAKHKEQCNAFPKTVHFSLKRVKKKAKSICSKLFHLQASPFKHNKQFHVTHVTPEPIIKPILVLQRNLFKPIEVTLKKRGILNNKIYMNKKSFNINRTYYL